MKRIILLLLTVFCMPLTAAETWLDQISDPQKSTEVAKRWHADGGSLNLMFFYDMLEAKGVEVLGTGKYDKNNWTANRFILPIKPIGGLSLKVPYGNLTGVDKGSLTLDGQFQWQSQNFQVDFNGLSLRSSTKGLKQGDLVALEMVNADNQVMFYLDHIHATLDKNKQILNLENMDVIVSDVLAKLIGNHQLAGLTVGQAHVYSNLTLPLDGYVDISQLKGSTCAERPKWPGPGINDPKADVALIEMSAQQQRSLGNGSVVITPSARLKNVGGLDDADVTWYSKFSGVFDPYDNAQHPFLIWNMYREIDGRFEQIGVSGVKHAFLTINSFCTINCNDNHILWAGCEDVYGTGNNDSGSALGPREEISAYDGTWEQQCSFFDQDCNNSQDNSSNSTDENRMVVADADLGISGASYFVSSWYVVRDDINIFNTMGYKAYNITGSSGNWSLAEVGGLVTGPASDQYVAPNTFDLNSGRASQRIIQAGEGHLTVAVKVIDLGAGQYRYNYMIENHDYDPQVQTVELPLSDLASLTNFVFADTDEELGNDWTFSRSNDTLTLQAPADNEIDWGILYSFSFTTNSAPQAGSVTLTGLENGATQFSAGVITPFIDDLIFASGFETLN